jgi:hypothetical protein
MCLADEKNLMMSMAGEMATGKTASFSIMLITQFCHNEENRKTTPSGKEIIVVV